MKILHQLDPVVHLKEKSDDIRTYGCVQVNLLFMLKSTEPISDQQAFVALVQRMMEAACKVIDDNNKLETTPRDEKSPQTPPA